MEFLDLSPYRYLPAPMPMVSIGWLGLEHGIQGGDRRPMEPAEVERLLAASTHTVSVTMGRHECEFCPEASAFQGNGEYHYYVADGEVYAAPVMLPHYVRDHGYRLPEEFRKALGATGRLAWDDRAELLCRMLADDSRDHVERSRAISDLARWQDPRALRALLAAAADPEFAGIAGTEIGEALAFLIGCDFAADLNVDDLPADVQYGISLHRPPPSP